MLSSKEQNMRLGMSLIVRDEADIIRENIKFHAQMGVDAFAIIDNGSTDGTREILHSLRSYYDLQVFDDRGPFEKERQSMLLAEHLRQHQHADWLISNDADEFWVPKSGDLKSLTNPSTPVLIAGRYNFLPRTEDVAADDYKFYQTTMLVDKPYGEQPPAPDPNEPLLFPIMLRTFPGKIMCALVGLEHVCNGNHQVRHAAGNACHTDEAVIYHYHIRSYKYFESKIRNHGKSLHMTAREICWHLRRWYAAYLGGTLRNEYESLLLSEEQARILLAAGVIREERIIANFFEAKSPAAQSGLSR